MKRVVFAIFLAVIIFGCSPKTEKESDLNITPEITQSTEVDQSNEIKVDSLPTPTDTIKKLPAIPNKKRKNYDYLIERYLAGYTSGSIRPNENITIRFTENMVGKEMIDKVENRGVISLEPKVKGIAVWKDRNTLVFNPNKNLKKGKQYNVKVNISNIVEEDVKIQPFWFYVDVMYQYIVEFQADFSETNRDDNTNSYFGKVSFLLPTNLDQIKQATGLKIKGNSVILNWEGAGTQFTFRSVPFERLGKKVPIDFKIDKRVMEMRRTFVRESSLYSLHEMDVILAKRIHEQEKPGVEVQFSDYLDLTQDVDGYFSVNPKVNFKLKKLQNKILINGDFEFGKKYTIHIKKGISNKIGLSVENDYSRIIKFNDENPQLVFAKAGCFLPSGNNKKIQFRSINVKKATLTVKHVFENNLNFFLQNGSLQSAVSRTEDRYSNFNRVGIEVINKNLELGEVSNEWLLHELDLSDLIPDGDNGLYWLELRFNKKDINYRGMVTGGNDYYTNPLSNGYYYRNGRIVKPIILTDIGLTLKQCSDRFIVYTTDLMTAKPLSGCKVELKTFQNQVWETQSTNSNGKAEFSVPDGNAYFVEANYKGQRTILKTNEMKWNTSNFDVEGVQYSARGIRAYTYTERGVYRPGDSINLSMILRTHEGTLADGHPVDVEVRNPNNQLIENRLLKNGVDGFYNFRFSTNSSDPTGNWKVKMKVGGSVFYHTLKIETVVAERLKVELMPQKEKVSFEMKQIDFDLQANYLFGAPGSNLHSDVNVEIYKNTSLFNIPRYRTFSFENPAIQYKLIELELFNDKLDSNGYAQINWKLPDLSNAPTGLVAKIQATVSETGGRSSKEKIFLPIDPFEAYVGIKSTKGSWKKIGKSNKFQCILLDPDGNPQVGEDIRVRISYNRHYWWWDYGNRNRSFKDDIETELVKEIKLTSAMDSIEFDYMPSEYGKYLLEVTHVTKDGESHSAGQYFYASYWGRPDAGMMEEGLVSLKTDKEKYRPGDVAKVHFDAPENSMILVSLEKGDQVIAEYWKKGKGGKTSIEVPVTEEMVPNVYCSISIIQPHDQTDNDRPIRMYGIVPLLVYDSETRQNLTLTTPDGIKPNTKFTCKIQTEDHKKTQFTIAVVDEGLLSLTDHPSPDAWSEFYKKQLLGVKTFDNYGFIIGANNGDVFKTYSIGGGMAFEKKRKKQLSPEETKRFKPVCMYQGPIFTDKNGFAEIEFEMPEYMGAVRIMVVSAKGNHYGSIDKSIEVKEDVVILPTLPRMLAPGDKFTIPVEVFTTSDDVRDVNVSINVVGPIKIKGQKEFKLEFSKSGNQSVQFQAEVPKVIGTTKIVIAAFSAGSEVKSTTDIAIRPLSARISRSVTKLCKKGQKVVFDVPDDGVSGTNVAYITVSRLPKADLSDRLNRLIRYPYGCVEQTTSAVFPQLYLRDFIKMKNFSDEMITQNINDGIKRLKKYQRPEGGFSYWPGGRWVSDWSSNYAGHFLLAAKEKGYFVQQEMLTNWLRYQKSLAKSFKYPAYHRHNYYPQIYRLYLLAKAGKPELGSMNYFRETYLNKLQDTERWILAAAYKMAGVNKVAEEIAMTTGIVVDDYLEMSGSFGSQVRDKALILDAMISMNEKAKALELYLNLTEQLEHKRWYSTQTTGYTLMALGRFIETYYKNDSDDIPISGTIEESDGSKKEVDTKNLVINTDLSASFGDKASFKSTSNLEELFVTLNWNGVPLESEKGDKFEGMKIKNVFRDRDGHIISPDNLKQGDIFSQSITVTNLANIKLENVALLQILPSGWEIENERYNQDDKSKGRKKKVYNRNSVDYTDIRDDRIMWFFNLSQNRDITVELKIRAVTAGEFEMPATHCEAMYNNKYSARKEGRSVIVLPR